MKQKKNRSTRAPGIEYKFIWTTSFLLFLPSIAFSSMLPGKYQFWEWDANSKGIFSEAVRATDTYIPMVFRS